MQQYRHTKSAVPVRKFDPKRNAAAGIQAAVAEARRTVKRVIVDVGGDWCQCCHQMDQLFQQHPELVELREKNFITVAVYYGSDKKNEQALSRYPKVKGIPHLYVLDGSGSVLQSQHLTELRTGANYDPDKVRTFSPNGHRHLRSAVGRAGDHSSVGCSDYSDLGFLLTFNSGSTSDRGCPSKWA